MGPEPTTEQLIARGKEAYARNAYLAALEDLQEAARREPRFADLHNLVGLCLSLTGRPEAAVDAFDQALAVNPRYVEAHLNRAITLNDLGRLDEAREAFERAAQADGENSGGGFTATVSGVVANRHGELGDLYAAAGALPEAEEQYRRACEIRPRFLDLRNKLARTLLDLGRTDDAIAELRAVLDVNPAFATARITLGLALYRAGSLAAAEVEWERCLQQRPGNAQVSGYLRLLRSQRGADTAG
ncbi:MAG TPA: tetratricopeptide repeat protein [Longimicrobiaceae bacterium]|nr:tetratricopeptide repeat protein [Longimicrobiaceae bacterium]